MKIPITNTTKSQVNPNFQIPKEEKIYNIRERVLKNPNDKYSQIPSKSQSPNPDVQSVISKTKKFGSIGIWNLFGSIGTYLDFGFPLGGDVI